MRRTLAVLLAGAVNFGQQAPPSTGTPAAATAVIAGTIVDAATATPIDGAVVHISPSSGTLPSPLQLTDAKGRFLFTNLPAGSYSLRASKTGYLDGAYGADIENGITVMPVAIENGRHVLDARIAIGKPSTISGTVVDEAGEPMVNVFVRALRVVMFAGTPQLASGRVVSTDDRGVYRLNGLAAGRYIVMLPSVSASAPAARTGEILTASRDSQSWSYSSFGVPKPDGAFAGEHDYVAIGGAYPLPPGREPRAYPPLFHPAGRAMAEALPIALALGEERSNVNFTWAPVPASTVSGRLAGPSDVIGNVLIRLTPIGNESLPPGGEVATTWTKADGSFTFLRVANGEYSLIASRSYAYLSETDGRALPRPPGFREDTGGGATIPGSEVGYAYLSDRTTDTYTARQRVSVGGGAVTGLSVQLRPNVRLRGRVIIESGAFSIQGASGGSPAPPTTGPVRAEPASGDLTLGVPGGMFDSTNGTFYVDGVQTGEYTLRFMGLPMVKSIVIGGADYTTRPIDTAAARGLDEIVVTVTDKAATLSGTVVGASSRDPAVVIYFPTDRTQWSKYGFRPTRIGSTGVANDGSYRIELPAGEYFVVAVTAKQNRLWQDPARLEAASASATRVKLAWDDKHTETLTLKAVK
ncbi:MAG TPA: carboxypeptidase regulatory-like domain-containing protein [Vicinamibacterales bacterium]|nr:carboxypeptidase regulatory-like domain-containing protein [Vicinamibacterales bacterium]